MYFFLVILKVIFSIDFVIVKDKIYQQYSITVVVKVLLLDGNNLVEIDSESFSPAGGNQGIAGY